MRTTLDIDNDVLQAAKERARREKKTMGEIISELSRKALTSASTEKPMKSLHGFRPFPKRGGVVTNDLIGKLREDDAY